jgi:hypothetical protein
VANSTNIPGDLQSVLTNGASATTKANAIAAGGPIQDYQGNVNLLLTKSQEMAVLIARVIAVTDSGTDSTNRNLLLGVQNDLGPTPSF